MSELKAKQLNKRKIVESSKTSKKSSSDSSKSIKSKKTKHSKDYDNSDDNDGNDSIEEEQGSDDNDNDDDDDDDDENDDDDDDENENEENDEDNNSKAKKKKISKPMKVKSKVKPKTKSESNGSSDKVLKIKKLTKLERLEEARKAFKWWEAADLPEGINWRYLEHPGMVFPASYIPHGVPMKYDGQILKLNPEQEELATFYAAIPEDGPQLGIAESRVLFQKNFFDEFKTYFPSSIMKDFKKCDFGLIKEHLEIQKNLKKAATAEEKEMKKEEKDKIQLKYSYALVDGRLEKVGNYNMEPPGLFRGRGVHPKTGTLKKRCFPESVSVNVSMDATVPICSMAGHAWESVRHDPGVSWLCTWTENVQNQTKYVMLAASSTFKGKSDQDKYSTAIKLKHCIDDVRKDYIANLDSKDISKKELGVAMWVIDRLALRVGGEKGENEADTVGCCSLRREHLHFAMDIDTDAPISGTLNREILLQFLGKDSMLYKQTVNFDRYGPIGVKVFECLRAFCRHAAPSKDVFEHLTPSVLNKHLNGILPGLTAKVFRTYNASVTLETELPSASALAGLSVAEKVARYNTANRQVAILCNHQKTVSKATETMFEGLHEKLAVLQRQREELTEWLKIAKGGSKQKMPLKGDDREVVEVLQEKLASAVQRKETAKTTEEKLAAALQVEEARAALKKDQGRRFEEKHMFKTNASADTIKARIDKWTEDIERLELDIRSRDENKEVALGTSKINYMDPRISVAWCKRCEVPIDKIFPKTLRDKFNWAMAVPGTWKFE